MSVQDEVARLFVTSLAAAGVRDVVISPGSRSTPFVHAAGAHDAIRVHVVVDERAAGFFALGRAKATGEPVALLCTSGSAGAHYHPAIVEAAYAYVPLVVLTADRPPWQQGCGASQTVDQTRMFGAHVHWYAELAPDARTVPALRAVRRLAAQAVSHARGPVPGPVHVNLPADKPLEPQPSATDEEARVEARARAVAVEPHVAVALPRLAPDDATVRSLAARIARARRGLVVCGPAPLAQHAAAPLVHAFAAAAGYPLLAEATSQLRFPVLGGHSDLVRMSTPVLDAFELVLGVPGAAERLRPELIVQIGAPPVSSRWDAWLASLGGSVERVVIDPHGWPDPHGTATELVQCDVRATLDALLTHLRAEPDQAWLDLAASLDLAAWAAVTATLREGEGRTEGAMTRALVESLPDGAILCVSNSLPVRHLDAFCPGSAVPPGVRVLGQRGAAGIDGVVASACGAASAADAPVALLCGDLALLHDLSSLELARRVTVPFAVVVLNNDGGRIFEQLPVARAPATAAHIDRWTTPHGLRFEHAAALFGHRYARVETAADVRSAALDALARPGCTLIEATVAPDGAAREAARLRARVSRVIEEESPR